MKKRQFLATSLVATASTLALAATATAKNHSKTAKQVGPHLLTITGSVTHTNRPPFNAGSDILMGKHKLNFDKARSFDFASLASLPSVTIKPTLEYDGKVHQLSGPRLSEVLSVCGIEKNADGERFKIALRAIDGYAAVLTLSQIRKLEFIIATHIDGQPMAIGALGPLWAVFDADRHADVAALPLKERFSQCPWGLYHIDIAT